MAIVNDIIVSMLSADEAAQQLRVSPVRVRQLLSKGALVGHKSGRIWLVDEHSVSKRLRRQHDRYHRPLSARMSCALLDALDACAAKNAPSQQISAPEQVRIRKYLQRLQADADPAAIIRDWLKSHEQMRPLRYVGEVTDLEHDPRLALTGFSHPLCKLVSNGQLDVRCAASDVTSVVSDHLLIDDRDPNVYLHFSSLDRQRLGLGTLLTDLASHASAREDEEVHRLLEEFCDG